MMTKSKHPKDQFSEDLRRELKNLREAIKVKNKIPDEVWDLISQVNHSVYTGSLNRLSITIPWLPNAADQILLALQKTGFELVKESYSALYGTRYFYLNHSGTGNQSQVRSDVVLVMDSRAEESACIIEPDGEQVTPLFRVRCAEAV
jgi:hypothetical protein